MRGLCEAVPLKVAIELAEEMVPGGDIVVSCYRKIGEVYIATGELLKAEGALSNSLRIAQKTLDNMELRVALLAFAILKFHGRHIDYAKSYLNEDTIVFLFVHEKLELARHSGNHAKAARDSGVSHTMLYRWLKRVTSR